MIDLPVTQSGKVGSFNLSTGEIEVNSKFTMRFECKLTGDCCRRHQIPVSEDEVNRIRNKGHNNFLSDLPPVESPEGKTFYLKRTEGVCTFLRENKCSIHNYKPFSCRLFPFKIIPTGKENSFIVTVPEQNTCPNVTKPNKENATNRENLEYIMEVFQRRRSK